MVAFELLTLLGTFLLRTLSCTFRAMPDLGEIASVLAPAGVVLPKWVHLDILVGVKGLRSPVFENHRVHILLNLHTFIVHIYIRTYFHNIYIYINDIVYDIYYACKLCGYTYIYITNKGTGTSLASHHFRSPSARPQFYKDTSNKDSSSSFGMLAMDVSISSTSTCLLPATFLWQLYVQKYQDTSEALHWSMTSRQALVIDSIFLRASLPAKFYYFDTVSIYKFLYLSLSTPLSRLWGKSCTLSPASFSPICGWTVHIFAEQKGPGHLSYWHHPNSIPAKFYYNFPDISLSTPLSRLWGMSCTSSPTLLSPICSWNAHFSFAGLMCLYSFPKRHYSLSWQLKLEGAARGVPGDRGHSCELLISFCGTVLQSERQSRTLLCVTGPDSFLVAFSFGLPISLFFSVGWFHLANSIGPRVLGVN